MDHIDGFLYIDPSLDPWDEACLVVKDGHFDVLLGGTQQETHYRQHSKAWSMWEGKRLNLKKGPIKGWNSRRLNRKEEREKKGEERLGTLGKQSKEP